MSKINPIKHLWDHKLSTQVKFGTRAQPPKSIDWNRFKEMQPDLFSLITTEKHKCYPLLINSIGTHSLHIRWLIKQSCMFYRIQYGLVHITPPACIQRATHISARTDHPLKYINTFIPTINAYKLCILPKSNCSLEQTTTSSSSTHCTIRVSFQERCGGMRCSLFIDFISFNWTHTLYIVHHFISLDLLRTLCYIFFLYAHWLSTSNAMPSWYSRDQLFKDYATNRARNSARIRESILAMILVASRYENQFLHWNV